MTEPKVLSRDEKQHLLGEIHQSANVIAGASRMLSDAYAVEYEGEPSDLAKAERDMVTSAEALAAKLRAFGLAI